MTLKPPTEGWWAVDVAGFLLSRLEQIEPAAPSALDPELVIPWIRENELDWAPGCADLRADVPWAQLEEVSTDAELVRKCLRLAVTELSDGGSATEAVCGFAARRHIPDTTLCAFGVRREAAVLESIGRADGHVHQGASLPLEVIVHWISRSCTSIGRASEATLDALHDTSRVPFSPLPLLLLLRHLVERPGGLLPLQLALARAASEGDARAWDELDRAIGFPERSEAFQDADALISMKQDAIDSWDPDRFVAMLKVESILHAALTQRKPGLDVFVEIFEELSVIRRGRLNKQRYFARAIMNHCVKSSFQLRRLELRLGEPVAGKSILKDALEREYEAALGGYREYVVQRGQERPPRVSFPLSMVKSPPGTPIGSEYWRYNAAGIYALTETLLEVLESHPELRRFADGIDVCGWEESQPNWLFAPAFARFATATAELTPAPACRFHAGESQWTPLTGLRRIAEVLRFEIPPTTPIRLGHGLALQSDDWRRFGEQPADELFDDLVWARERIDGLEVAPSTKRLVERLILDLRQAIYPHSTAREASVEQLIHAYGARFDADALESISFLQREPSGRLSAGERPTERTTMRLRVLTAHLSAGRPDPPTARTALEGGQVRGITLDDMQGILSDLYELLVGEIIDDVRWRRVVVEACPSSNLMAGGVRGLSRHPMRNLVSAGLLVTVNSDDPSLFHSWVSDELAHAEGGMGVPKRQVSRARELGLGITAPDLGCDGLKESLDRALKSLETPVVN